MLSTMKKFVFAFVLALPLFAFAETQYEIRANDATFYNVSVGCYGAFRTAFGMLPEITDKINEQAGQELIVISNVKTPLGNPSTFSLTVEKSPTGMAEGNYKLYQKYTNNTGTLYLRIDQMPSTLPGDQLDKVWELVAKGFAACTL